MPASPKARPGAIWTYSPTVNLRGAISVLLGSVVIAGAAASATAVSDAAGAPDVTVPDVLGLPALKAAYRIDLSELEPLCRDAHRRGTVVEQRPAAGTSVARGSVVIIFSGDGGCTGVKRQPTTTSTPAPTGPAPALRTHTPTVIVTPSTNLTGGETVEVAVTGFGVGGKFWISECARAVDANTAGCGPPFGVFGVTTTTGSGSQSFTVSSSAPTGPTATSSTLPCADQCVIVATVGIGYGYAYAPITFGSG